MEILSINQLIYKVAIFDYFNDNSITSERIIAKFNDFTENDTYPYIMVCSLNRSYNTLLNN